MPDMGAAVATIVHLVQIWAERAPRAGRPSYDARGASQAPSSRIQLRPGFLSFTVVPLVLGRVLVADRVSLASPHVPWASPSARGDSSPVSSPAFSLTVPST